VRKGKDEEQNQEKVNREIQFWNRQ
jgi:hypothetical protein